MNRAPVIALVAACALWCMVSPGHAQTDPESPQAQRIRELQSTLQGVLLPLDGALDPVTEATLATPPPPEPEPEPAPLVDDGMAGDGEAAGTGRDAAAPPDDTEVVVEVLPEADAPAETPEENTGQAAEEGMLPELDAIDGVVVAELGNPASIGPYRLWLASYGTIREAQAGWQQLAKDNRDVLGDLLPVIVMKELGGESGTFFRLQAGPLAEASLAETRCETLKARALYCAILGPDDG